MSPIYSSLVALGLVLLSDQNHFQGVLVVCARETTEAYHGETASDTLMQVAWTRLGWTAAS